MSKENESGFTPEEVAELANGDDALETETGAETVAGDNGVTDATTSTDAGTGKPAVTKPPPGYVPQESLHEARQRIKEEKARADRLESTFQRFMERQGQTEKKPEAPQIRDPNTDPVGNLEDRLRIAEERLAEASKTQEQRITQEQQHGETQEKLNKYANSVRSFIRAGNDFEAAHQYLTDILDKEMEARGFDDQNDRTNRILYEEGLMVGRSLMAGKDPAKAIYDYAVFRGYKPPSAAANDNKLARLQQGQQAAKSLSGGKPPDDGEMTLDKLSQLYDSDPDEADKLFAKMRRAGRLG